MVLVAIDIDPKQRDGFPSDPDNIFLTNGASAAIQNCRKFVYTDPFF